MNKMLSEIAQIFNTKDHDLKEHELNKLDKLIKLDPQIIASVIENGEEFLKHQFGSHTSGTNRSFLIAAFLFTMSANFFSFFALNHERIGLYQDLIWPSLLMSLGLGFPAMLVAFSIIPGRFSYPGNEPLLWLPQNWYDPKKVDFDASQIERAKTLQYQIERNRKVLNRKAITLKYAIGFSFLVAIGCMIWVLLIIQIKLD